MTARVDILSDGMHVTLQDGTSFRVKLVEMGYGATRAPVGPVEPVQADEERWQLTRDLPPVREWFHVQASGKVAHGFVLQRRMKKSPGEPLTLVMAAGPALTLRLDPDGAYVQLVDKVGPVLKYARRHAVDSIGNVLVSRLVRIANDQFGIEVEDEKAIYPVYLDPPDYPSKAGDDVAMHSADAG